jgi:hypothetical protein
MKPNTIIIDPQDNVAVALEDISTGKEIALPDGRKLSARVDIPYSHKVVLVDLAAGLPVIKYGEVIGRAKTDLKPGDWVHTHNLVAVED